MRDPLYTIEPIPASAYYRPLRTPAGGWPKRTEPSIESENKLHSNIRLLVREKDVLFAELNVVKLQLQTERRWRRWLTAAFVTTWAFWFVVMKMMIPYTIKGILK